MTRRLALALLLAFAPLSSFAQNRPPPPPSAQAGVRQVSMELMVVHATDSRPGVDPRLASLASSFRYFKYQGYWLLSTQRSPVGVGDGATFSVEGDRRVKVTLVSVDEERARVRVEMSNRDGKLLDTTVSINRNGTFIVAGPKYQDGILMLPLRASY